MKVVKLTYGLPEGVPESSPPLFPLFYAQVTRCFDLDGINADFIVMLSSDETSSEINIFWKEKFEFQWSENMSSHFYTVFEIHRKVSFNISVAVFLVSWQNRETRNEKFIFREISSRFSRKFLVVYKSKSTILEF